MESGIGAIGLGGKSSWNVEDELTELKHEKAKTVTKPTGKTSRTGENLLNSHLSNKIVDIF